MNTKEKQQTAAKIRKEILTLQNRLEALEKEDATSEAQNPPSPFATVKHGVTVPDLERRMAEKRREDQDTQ